MTFREFAACIEGHRRREERDMDKRDWELRTHLSVWSKRRLLPGELLGKRQSLDIQEVAITSAEQFHAEAKRRQALAQQRKEAKSGERRR